MLSELAEVAPPLHCTALISNLQLAAAHHGWKGRKEGRQAGGQARREGREAGCEGGTGRSAN